MNSNGSLCVLIVLYASLRVPIGLYVFLWFLVSPYVSL